MKIKENLSSSTLFHFTGSIENLSGILKNGIFIRYSLESYGDLIEGRNEIVLPMACFCDIPLSKIKEHTKKYGSYSIGLSKEWGMKNGLSPVIYSHSNSETAKTLNTISENIVSFMDIESDDNVKDEFDIDISTMSKAELKFFELGKYERIVKQANAVYELQNQLSHFAKYIKPYTGKGYSNGNKFENIRFYDEREWRYVPSKELLKSIEVKDSYEKKYYTDPIKKRLVNIRLATHKKLSFEPNDVKFIIVEKEGDIPKMIKTLTNIFGASAPHDDVMLLTTRLISLEKVLEDL